MRPLDEEDREDAPDDRRRRGGKGACGAGAGTGDDRSTLMLPMGRLSPLFRLIMAGSLGEFFSRVGLCNFMIELLVALRGMH